MSRYIFLHNNILYLSQRGLGLVLSDSNPMNITIAKEELCKDSEGNQVILAVTEATPSPELLTPVSDNSKFADIDTFWAVRMVNLLGELAHLPPEARMDDEQVKGTIGLVLQIIN